VSDSFAALPASDDSEGFVELAVADASAGMAVDLDVMPASIWADFVLPNAGLEEVNSSFRSSVPGAVILWRSIRQIDCSDEMFGSSITRLRHTYECGTGTWCQSYIYRVLAPTKLRLFALYIVTNFLSDKLIPPNLPTMSAFKRKAAAAFTGRLIVPKKKRVSTSGPIARMMLSQAVQRQRMRRRNVRTAGFLGIETKFYDTSLGATALTAPTDASGGEFDPSATSMISTPAQGDTEQNRDGKRIVIRNVHINGNIVVPPGIDKTAMPGQVDVFVALVLDTQSNGAQMNSEDCFKNLSGAAAQAPNPIRNLLFGPRFRVLKSQNFLMPIPSASYDGTNIEIAGTRRDFDWFLNLKDLVVNFNATTPTVTTIASVVDNSLHVIAYCNSTSLAPTIAYNARIRFVG